MNDHRPKFCSVPWNELYLGPNGTYDVCCFAKDNHSTRINIDQSIAFYRNSDSLKQLRKDFIDGKSIPMCDWCWREEDSGNVSGRIRRNQRYFSKGDLRLGDVEIQSLIDSTSPDGSTDQPVLGLHFYVGNQCQLRCIDCNPTYSRSILKDYDRLGWPINFKTRKQFRDLDLANDRNLHTQHLWQRVTEVADNVQWLQVSGGEPTLSIELLKFLQDFAQRGYAGRTALLLNTNCVNIKQPFIDAMKPFKMVRLNLSVDGVGKVDEYLRYPTNWSKKETIIDQLLAEFNGNTISTTVYNLNVADLPVLIDWAISKNVNHSIITLSYPEELQIQNLPTEYKQEIINSLLSYQHHNVAVSSIINQLQQPCDPAQWQKTKDIINGYDSIRPFKLEQAVPGFKKYIHF